MIEKSKSNVFCINFKVIWLEELEYGIKSEVEQIIIFAILCVIVDTPSVFLVNLHLFEIFTIKILEILRNMPHQSRMHKKFFHHDFDL